MAAANLNAVDVAIISLVFVVMVLIVRGLVRGSIKTCDTGNCGGNCASCGHVCATPRIKLTEAQLAELHEIDQRAKEV